MTAHGQAPDPGAIHTLDDLVAALGRLRRAAAPAGRVQLSLRELAARIHRAPSTLQPYLSGDRLCPADVYADMLGALGIAPDRQRPWLDAWDRVTDRGTPRTARRDGARPGVLRDREVFRYRIGRSPAELGVVTGDLRRVDFADVWVNSENTAMRMSRVEEYSVSAIIRFEGAVRDATGHVLQDRVADELAAKVADGVPVAACTAITTGAGELAARNGVRHVIHVAAARGEPGEGYRQVADVGRCVTNVLAEAERLAAAGPVRTVLLPLLGVGVAGGRLEPTVRAMAGAAVHHFASGAPAGVPSRLTAVYLLASTGAERDVCLRVLDANPALSR